MSVKKLLKSFWRWFKAELVEEISDRIDIDGDKPEMGGGIFAEEPQDIAADGVPFGDLLWSYGGFKGAGATLSDGVRIADLRVSKSGLSYRFSAGDLRKISLGNSHENPDCLACLFCLLDGEWRGGKFDWISSDRLSRDFRNIETGYHGWPPDAIRRAAGFAFVILSKDGKRRTNVSTFAA